MDKRYRFRRIKAIELLNLPPEWDKRSYYLNIVAGNVDKKTKVYKAKKKDRGTTSATPRWALDLALGDIEECETFEVDVYSRGDRSLGFFEASIQDIVIGEDNTIVMNIQSKSSCPGVSLKIFREDAVEITQSVAGEDQDVGISATPQGRPSKIGAPGKKDTSELSGLQLVPMSATSVEDDHVIGGNIVEDTPKSKEPSEWVSKLIDGIDTVESMVDAVKDIHPAAKIAWGFLSFGVNTLKRQTEQDKTVLRLYQAMISTYKAASDDRLLWNRKPLKPIYESLFHITNECGMLVKRYIGKNRLKRLLPPNVSKRAEEFMRRFEYLGEQLDSGVAKDTLAATQDVRAKADTRAMQNLLQELNPLGGLQVRPKSECMPGTRVETINTLVSWIAECEDSVLWCSGLAGTGISSLVGTLHKLLSFHMGGRNRLAAFIQYDNYDRTLHRDSSELITSIAYSLGMFDQRIGNAIAEALAVSRAAIKMPASQSRTKFRLLVQEPLETIQELQDEGPLVVIIDGLDESDVSEDILEVLADGFGPTLSFMRLIVFSRPEGRISRVFKNCQHVYHFPLDISSSILNDDIRYFIRQRFAKIKDETVWGTYTKEAVVAQLVERASGLFIWAHTVCSVLCTLPSFRRVEVFLETTIPADAMDALTILYRTTLDIIVSEIESGDEDIRRCIRAVLGALIVRKGKVTVPILAELVLQPGDPRAQLIIDKLGSVVQEKSESPVLKSKSLELIHKSFNAFLRDHGRSGDQWFIDVKEHEKELAQRCVLTLTTFFKNWTSPSTHPCSSNVYHKATILDQYYHLVPSHIGDYAVNVLGWHLDAILELGIDTYRPLFDRYFLFWLEILYAFLESPVKRYAGDLKSLFPDKALLKVISMINAEVTDQSLRTYVYHAFIFWERFNQFSTKYTQVNPAYVYTHAMSISPSANFICRDWGRSSGVNAPFDKERLLALIPWRILTSDFNIEKVKMFQGSRHIQYEVIIRQPWPVSIDSESREAPYSEGSVLFDIDTGRILDPSPPSILQRFPNSRLPSSYEASVSYNSFDASGQIVRLMHWDACHGNGSQYFNGTQYEIIEWHDSDPQGVMLPNVDDDDNCDQINTFISIANTQTSHCDSYLLPAIGRLDCPVPYAHGLLIVGQWLGLMLSIEPGTTGRKKLVTLDGGAREFYTFAVREEDGSRLLLGLTADAGKISLREWETSTGTLRCTRTYDRSDFGYDGLSRYYDDDDDDLISSHLIITRHGTFRHAGRDGCFISPDGSNVAVTMAMGRPYRAYILEITSGLSADIIITDLMDARCVTWFPDSKRIAYFRSWQCEHGLCDECCELVVQRLASRQITTIYRWYDQSQYPKTFPPNILAVTPDGSRVITQDEEEFRTWDVSDL